MNIQIFGTKKCKKTQKAQRWFKERNIQFQFINLKEKKMSPGEFNSVVTAVGGLDAMTNTKSKEYASIAYVIDDDKAQTLFENQENLLCTPIVRNGHQATCGMQAEIWKNWQ
ncbi:MAG TPA: ArsC/Spx/MgsR family protein [Treponemataceae bacterium]|nr:ArsC/Spx/MgsR family protein [Treponemataceae bacterium]